MARACLVLMGDELNIDNENKRRQGMDLRRSRAMVVNDIFEIDEDENNLSPLENALNRKKLTNIACKYFWVSFLIFLFLLSCILVGLMIPDSYVKEGNETWSVIDRVGWSATLIGVILPIMALFYNCSSKCCKYYCIGCRDCCIG